MPISTRVIMASKSVSKFSINGEYFGYGSPDGTLKLWQTINGILKQEYTHSTHLTAVCSCIGWGPVKKDEHKSKKKRRSSTGDALSKLELVALGTTSGSIMLYSLTKGDLHTQLTGGHTDVVNGVCWNSKGNLLYSCASDHYIVEWDVAKAEVRQRWKGDKGAIQSIGLCESERHLLSASHNIKLWDIDSQKLLQTFNGHGKDVFSLVPLGNKAIRNGSAAVDGVDEHLDVEGSYFLSAADGDRIINAWQVRLSSEKNKRAICSFALPEEPVYMQVCEPKAPGQHVLLLAITKSGQLLVFEHTLNGRMAAPLSPRYTIQISTSKAEPQPILSATVNRDGDDTDILIAYGNFMHPTFEHLPYCSLETSTVLVRDDTSKLAPQLQTSVSKVKTPQVTGDVTILTPGHMAPQAPQREDGTPRRKRKKSSELSMEEQLHAISSGAPAGGEKKGAPKANQQAMLLAQGLKSDDKAIINTVLNQGNESTIRKSVRLLPLPVIVPLMEELTRRLRGNHQNGAKYIKWARIVLTIHNSYLMTIPGLVKTLSGLYEMIASRRAMFARLSELQGKLDLVLSQVTAQGEDAADTEAMAIYESDDDEIGLEEMGMKSTETDDEHSEFDIDDEGDEEEKEENEEDNDDADSSMVETRQSKRRKMDSMSNNDSNSDSSSDGE